MRQQLPVCYYDRLEIRQPDSPRQNEPLNMNCTRVTDATRAQPACNRDPGTSQHCKNQHAARSPNAMTQPQETQQSVRPLQSDVRQWHTSRRRHGLQSRQYSGSDAAGSADCCGQIGRPSLPSAQVTRRRAAGQTLRTMQNTAAVDPASYLLYRDT